MPATEPQNVCCDSMLPGDGSVLKGQFGLFESKRYLSIVSVLDTVDRGLLFPSLEKQTGVQTGSSNTTWLGLEKNIMDCHKILT